VGNVYKPFWPINRRTASEVIHITMDHQFLFFCVNLGNENLLKEEIRLFYPELALSYSRKGFLTFKNKGVLYNAKTIAELAPTFATRSGLCFGKSNPDKLVEKVLAAIKNYGLNFEECLFHSFSINTEFEIDASALFGNQVNQYSADGKNVINLITLAEQEVWYGHHIISKGITRFPNGKIDIIVPENSPSKAFLKIAEVVELYGLKITAKDLWIDFGSAPGGASQYLLSKGCKVWGVDPARMPKSITKNRNYTHITSAVQDLSQEKLPDQKITWIHVDLNLNPKQAIKEVLRLIKKFNFSLRGIIFTIQLVKLEYIEFLEEFEDIFYDWGFTGIISRQVPSHKQEYVLIAKKV
jgi:23S rRNA (cytidine2498-2'-O)-methyltransferase